MFAVGLVVDDAVDAAVFVGELGKADRTALFSAALATLERAAGMITVCVVAVEPRETIPALGPCPPKTYTTRKRAGPA